MNEEKSFEQVLNELQKIVNDLEQSNLPLDTAIEQFEKGIQLTKEAEHKLQDIKDKVTKIVNDNKISDFKINE